MEDYRMRRDSGLIVPIVIIIILVIAVLCLGFYTYNLKIKLDEAESKNSETSNQEDDESNVLNTDNSNEEESIELSKDDSIVQELLKKIDFPTHAIASIYGVGTFNSSTIPNDLILRLAWAKADKEMVSNNTDKNKQTVTMANFEKALTEIFGTRVSYTNNSFTNINVPTFHGYYKNLGVINYTGDSYTADYSKVGGNHAPFIHQEVDKVLKYEDRIEVYVKTAFVNTNNSAYTIYKNFNNSKFQDKILDTTAAELDKQSDSSFTSNSKILEISEELNSYVYTFYLNGFDGNYYLSAFNSAM